MTRMVMEFVVWNCLGPEETKISVGKILKNTDKLEIYILFSYGWQKTSTLISFDLRPTFCTGTSILDYVLKIALLSSTLDIQRSSKKVLWPFWFYFFLSQSNQYSNKICVILWLIAYNTKLIDWCQVLLDIS